MKKQKNITHDDAPATVGLVKAVREELKADIRSLGRELRTVEHRLESKIEKVLVSVHHTQVLMEEQRGENRIVLDGSRL